MARRRQFTRDPEIKVKIKPAFDDVIFLWLEEYELIRSHDLADLCGRSVFAMRGRLLKLYHGGYIARISDPEAPDVGGGSKPHIVANDNGAAAYLAEKYHITFRDRTKTLATMLGRPSTAVKRWRRIANLEHELRIPATIAAFCRATKDTPIRPIFKPQILTNFVTPEVAKEEKPFSWQVPVEHQGKMYVRGIEPDEVFGLHDTSRPEGRNRSFFFLEIDEGTENTYLSDIELNSIFQKILCYSATNLHKIHTSRFGMNNFRTLWLVPDNKRRDDIFRMFDRHRVRALPGFRPATHLINTHEALLRTRHITDGWVNCDEEVISLAI